MNATRKVVPLEGRSSRLLRQMAASKGVEFGTSVPHGVLGDVGFATIGFADIAAVGFTTICKDPDDLIAVARQHIMRVIEANGLDTGAVDLTVHALTTCRRRFVDVNHASKSAGSNKVGTHVRFWLEIVRREVVAEFKEQLPRNYTLTG